MDDDRADTNKPDEVLLPGFRFHPTDEELISFYLRRKIQQRPLSVELIRQLDIYKYDPWDLPSKHLHLCTVPAVLLSLNGYELQCPESNVYEHNSLLGSLQHFTSCLAIFAFTCCNHLSSCSCIELASTGEKEWYFYCPRDRKYQNSARPNRVTGAGFWKATGTDRPVYSSEGAKCIGLKKSLVFYKGRAAKGIKTDWMMHEYRLPSLGDPSRPNKTPKDKNIPANVSILLRAFSSSTKLQKKIHMCVLHFLILSFQDAWAICRVFKKPNSVAQRVLSRSWGPASIATADPELLPALQSIQASRFALETSTCSANRFNSQLQQNLSSSQDGSSCKVITFNRSPYLPSEKTSTVVQSSCR